MLYKLGGTILVLVGLVAGGVGTAAAGAPLAPAATPTPGPTLTCPPALPVSGGVTAATATSLTVTYSMLLTPPCGYNPPVTVTLFAGQSDAQQWLNPVAEAVSGPERSGKVTLDGLTPDTAYWFRFSADGRHDPYVIGTGRTAAVAVCTATAAIDSAWSGGFVATVTVRNVGAETLTGWRVSWQWLGGERILSLWNAVAQGDSAVGNASYNGTLAPSGATTFGMLVSGAPPTGIALTCAR
ncbi:cellulose binding domain-containing protein [Actinoplanes sp. CA-142083]|uniref:cellulose binding domain-containing protein n=1 Tax=Actinoplanes sp. CA-142083 TaxID=3239903 RepID=UPI003D8EB8F6